MKYTTKWMIFEDVMLSKVNHRKNVTAQFHLFKASSKVKLIECERMWEKVRAAV